MLQTLGIDYLKAAVTRADWFEPELNPKLQAFDAHHGTVILPTKPYTPPLLTASRPLTNSSRIAFFPTSFCPCAARRGKCVSRETPLRENLPSGRLRRKRAAA